MNKRDFNQALREADKARERQDLSPRAEARLRARLERAYEGRRRQVLPLAFGALATAALAIFVVLSFRPEPSPALGTFVAVKQSAAGAPLLLNEGDVVTAEGDAVLRHEALRVRIAARDGAVVQREARGLRVVSGTVELDVDKRAPGESNAAFLVSHGAIEVLGTRFTITQGAAGGEVRLHEGRIRFVAPDGRTEELAPGQSLRWPLPAPLAEVTRPAPAPGPAPMIQAPAPAPPAPLAVPPPSASAREPSAVASTTPQRTRPAPVASAAPVPAPAQVKPPLDVERLIEEVSLLRRRGQFAEAAGRLESALREPLPPATTERLSYELGSILTWQVKDRDRACEVWKAHGSAHPNGRYAGEVKRAQTSLACE